MPAACLFTHVLQPHSLSKMFPSPHPQAEQTLCGYVLVLNLAFPLLPACLSTSFDQSRGWEIPHEVIEDGYQTEQM